MKAGHIDEKKLAREVQAQRRGASRRGRGGEDVGDTELEPEEHGENEDEHRPNWKHELLETMFAMPPDAFERLCQRILRESGFVEVRVTGQTSDKGIDGIGLLRLQGVLSFHVIFQCKRWREPVGAPTIRDFRGAMVGRTDKGLVMTTSYFTAEAVREATRDGAPAIDLIDGEQLVALLRKLKLGVATEVVERVTIDRDWFKTI